jgi:flavin reductase (DIM6/NTAB) family NADH-FMN oxidoreductase RutF
VIIFDPAQHSPERCQGMLSQLVTPRPIAMISTVDDDGIVNVAPFSYYMPVTGNPMLVAVTMGLRSSDGGLKHSYENAQRRGDFVVNVTTVALREHIETAAIEFPRGVSELDSVPWTPVPSQRVTSPSLAESPAHLECHLHTELNLGARGTFGEVRLVVGEVVCVTLDDSICGPDFHVDQTSLLPIGRMGFPWFTTVTPESMHQLRRETYEEFLARQPVAHSRKGQP